MARSGATLVHLNRRVLTVGDQELNRKIRVQRPYSLTFQRRNRNPRCFSSVKNGFGGTTFSGACTPVPLFLGGCTPVPWISPRPRITAAIAAGKPVSRATAENCGRVE